MARTFFSVMAQAARQVERTRRAHEREALRIQRQAERNARQAYLAGRQDEVDAENERLRQNMEALQCILATGLKTDSRIRFEKLVRLVDTKKLDDPALVVPAQPQLGQFLPPRPSTLVRWLPWVRKSYDDAVLRSKVSFTAATEQRNLISKKRLEAFSALQKEVDEFNSRLQEFKTGCIGGEPSCLCDYFGYVLQNSSYPDGFPQTTRAAFVKESAQLVVDYELPTMDDVAPQVEKYRFVKSQREVAEIKHSAKARSAIYADVLAQTVLRSLHEIYQSDIGQHIQSVVLNAHVSTVDAGTGKPIRPCLITVRTTRDEFLHLDLARVNPLACLKQLKAAISQQPDELVAVKPIVQFNMVDPRFIKEADVLSTIDQRPNLMELSPGEFESLITNLFSKMGLETKLTQASRDGGVDCVAYDQRPILGGKIVIQAKRYKNTVGVSSVRDLFGTMHNEGASKGILVTTSGYGKATYDFANNKPIELITGSNLLYLLREHANVDAKIEAPPDWVDPAIE
jgi:restriction system protein